MTKIKELVEHSFLITSILYQGSRTPKIIEKYQNGQTRFIVPMRNQLIHGLYRSWYEDGTLKIEEYYNRGRLDGMRKEYYSNEKIKVQERYEVGLSHGIRTQWDEKGNIKGKRLYVRGRLIDGELYEIINSREITAQDIIKVEDMETRRVCLDEMGYEKFVSQIEHDIIDAEDDCDLIRIDWHSQEEPIHLVRVKCPSMGVFYLLRVPPYILNAKQALAWTFVLPEDRYQPKIET